VLLKNTVGFQLVQESTIWAAIDPTGNSVSLAITIDRASADAEERGDS
jgi:hypothetical protein